MHAEKSALWVKECTLSRYECTVVRVHCRVSALGDELEEKSTPGLHVSEPQGHPRVLLLHGVLQRCLKCQCHEMGDAALSTLDLENQPSALGVSAHVPGPALNRPALRPALGTASQAEPCDPSAQVPGVAGSTQRTEPAGSIHTGRTFCERIVRGVSEAAVVLRLLISPREPRHREAPFIAQFTPPTVVASCGLTTQ